MKLGSLKSGGRDGTLIVVDAALRRAVRVAEIAPTLQAAVERWSAVRPELEAVSARLNAGHLDGFALDPHQLAAPLPRAYQWLDGSAYLSHARRIRQARGGELATELLSDPLMYQGVSDPLLGPRDPIAAADEAWGIDLEAEVAVVTDDVPMGVDRRAAAQHIALLMLVNDVSLRGLIPAELAKGFGFLHGKPPSAFSPVAVTPGELGAAWRDGKVARPLHAYVNGTLLGAPEAGEGMQFDFPALISHAARTRPLGAGTIIGSGTVSNDDASRGYCCLLEKRADEQRAGLASRTPFLRFGDRVRIEMRDAAGGSIFGAIEQQVCRAHPPMGSG